MIVILNFVFERDFYWCGIFEDNQDEQFASVRLQAASTSSFLAFERTLPFTVIPVTAGESAVLSASTVISTLLG